MAHYTGIICFVVLAIALPFSCATSTPSLSSTSTAHTPTTTPAQNKTVSDEDITVKVRGQSGKITFSRANNSVTVNFDYINELAADGTVVGASGRKKHSINTFAREQFTFTSSGAQAKYQNISVKHTQFEAKISGPGAKLIVDIYIFKGSGNVTTSQNESLEVKPGTIKFNIRLEDWAFCGANDTCKKGKGDEVGTQVEFGIEIKGRGAPKMKGKARGKGRKLKTMDLGGADCTLSGVVDVDGKWVEMASDYPKTESKGGKTLFIFRFPKFSRRVSYDPTIELAGGGGGVVNPTTAAPGPSDSAVVLSNGAFPMLIAIVATLFKLLY